MFRVLLQFLLEADGQDGEHSQDAKHRQGVPGHGLAGCGQLVQSGAGVDGDE